MLQNLVLGWTNKSDRQKSVVLLPAEIRNLIF